MKYIDAEKLKAEIRKLRSESCISESDDYHEYAKSEIIDIIDSLQQEQPIGEEYVIEIGKHSHTIRIGSQSDIDHLIHRRKQSEVDLEKEYTEFVESDPVYSKLVNGIVGKAIARHFAKWGATHLNVRKEE